MAANEKAQVAAKIAADTLSENMRQAQEEAEKRYQSLQMASEKGLASRLEAQKQELSLQHAKEIAAKIQETITETEARLEAEKEEMIEAMAQEVDELETKKDAEIAQHQKDLEAAQERITALTKAKQMAEDRARAVLQSKDRLRQDLKRVQDGTRFLKDDYQKLVTITTQQINEYKQSMKSQLSGGLLGRVKALLKELNTANEKFNKEYQERKKLHNIIQELKGNIRVYMRCRPPLKKELADFGEDALCVSHPSPGEVRVFNEKNREKTWEFDETFDVNSTQAQVYADVSGLVTSVMDGYNVCIFAYGQTGSGKTHTMAGSPQDRGVNWRALGELFTKSNERRGEMRDTITLSILEVYNEEIRDLLNNSGEKLEIRQGEFGNFVPGLTQMPVATLRDVEELFGVAESNRAVASTSMNEHSSRSHMMLTISVVSENVANGSVQRGKLNLVDLAGSERINKSGAAGVQLKEAQNINKSLSALGDVIAARASKQAHIPFRNSTLTHLLQDSLSKDSKTLMICCISPLLDSAEETYCSLNFASRVRSVELGQATKNAPVAAGSSGSRPTSTKR